MPVPDTNPQRLEYQNDMTTDQGVILIGDITGEKQNSTPQARRQFIAAAGPESYPFYCEIPETVQLVGEWRGSELGAVINDTLGFGDTPQLPASLGNDDGALVISTPVRTYFSAGAWRQAGEMIVGEFTALPDMKNFILEFDVHVVPGTQFVFTYRNKALALSMEEYGSGLFPYTYGMNIWSVLGGVDNDEQFTTAYIDSGASFDPDSGGTSEATLLSVTSTFWDETVHVVVKVYEQIHGTCVDGDPKWVIASPVRLSSQQYIDDQILVDGWNHYISGGFFGFWQSFVDNSFDNIHPDGGFSYLDNVKLYAYTPPLPVALNQVNTGPYYVLDDAQLVEHTGLVRFEDSPIVQDFIARIDFIAEFTAEGQEIRFLFRNNDWSFTPPDQTTDGFAFVVSPANGSYTFWFEYNGQVVSEVYDPGSGRFPLDMQLLSHIVLRVNGKHISVCIEPAQAYLTGQDFTFQLPEDAIVTSGEFGLATSVGVSVFLQAFEVWNVADSNTMHNILAVRGRYQRFGSCPGHPRW